MVKSFHELMEPVQKLRDQFTSLSPEDYTQWIESLEPEQLVYASGNWAFKARHNQWIPEGSWRVWLCLAGRGWGKTRVGAETTIMVAENDPEARIALVGATAADARDVMIEGESGIMSCSRPDFMPVYEPTKRRLTWPNGAMATAYSADKPDRLRGPQHSFAWLDELAAWRYIEAYDMLVFGLRLGDDPRMIVTTTPRPRQIIIDLVKHERTVISAGSTYENKDNLAPQFIEALEDKYEGTTLGRQEIYAQVLTEFPGSLWTRDLIERTRWPSGMKWPDFTRVVVGVDPAITDMENSNETGIIVAGRFVGPDNKNHAMIMHDMTVRGSPDTWGQKAVLAYTSNEADRVVAEVNNGGDLVEHVVRNIMPSISYKAVRASRGKQIRAEPCAALYEQDRVHHARVFAELEDQMCSYLPELRDEDSPDRLDASVWALTDLLVGARQAGVWGRGVSKGVNGAEARR